MSAGYNIPSFDIWRIYLMLKVKGYSSPAMNKAMMVLPSFKIKYFKTSSRVISSLLTEIRLRYFFLLWEEWLDLWSERLVLEVSIS